LPKQAKKKDNVMSVTTKTHLDEPLLATIDSKWKDFYKIGGIAALVFIVYSLVTMIILLVLGGRPESALEAFNLLESERIIALLRLDALTLLVVPLYYPLFLSIYAALRKTHIAYVTLGAVLAFAGITLFLATPSAFSLIPLSDRYMTATDPAQKDQLLSAGEALLAADMWHASGAIIGGILMLIAALLLSVIMLKSSNFSKATAYIGILTHGLDLAHGLIGIFLPGVGVILMAIAGPLYLLWFPLLARDLLRKGRDNPNAWEKDEELSEYDCA